MSVSVYIYPSVQHYPFRFSIRSLADKSLEVYVPQIMMACSSFAQIYARV